MASLVERVLAEWQIQHTMIHMILTDNGSNMVAALKHEQVYESDGELGEDPEEVEEERSNSSVIQANVNLIEDESCDEGQESGETAEEDIETQARETLTTLKNVRTIAVLLLFVSKGQDVLLIPFNWSYERLINLKSQKMVLKEFTNLSQK